MFIFSMKMSKKKLFLAIMAVILMITLIAVFVSKKMSASHPGESSDSDTAITDIADVKDYIESFGWEVEPEPCEMVEVEVPKEFNEVYENYNALQKKQGFDLIPFQGLRVRRITYVVTNYPEKPEHIRADVLVYENQIIGADICSIELSGFMHGINEMQADQ